MRLTAAQRRKNMALCLSDFKNGFCSSENIKDRQLCPSRFEKELKNLDSKYEKRTEQIIGGKQGGKQREWTRLIGFRNTKRLDTMLCGIPYIKKCYHKKQCHFFNEDRCDVE